MNFEFRFKQFGINHSSSSMKVSTDAVLLGTLTEIEDAKSILEIGCGCGIISLMLAQRSNCIIECIDIHQASVDEAQKNVSKTRWNNRIKVLNADARTYNTAKKFDIIVSNPPYFENSIKSESSNKSLARHNDTLNYNDLCLNVSRNLDQQGHFWLILPFNCFLSFTHEAIKSGLFCHTKIEIYDTKTKPISLIVSSWSFFKREINIRQLFIKEESGAFSNPYKKLTSEFYLNF